MYVFGKSIKYSFSPIIAGHPEAANSIVSGRLYDHSPTNAEKEDSSNALATAEESVTEWYTGSESNEKIITFAALTDSEPHSSDPYDAYYVVVSFRWESGAPIVFSSEACYVYRPDGWITRINVLPSEVITLEKTIESMLTNIQIESHGNLAKDRIFHILRARGYRREDLGNLRELNLAARYLTAASCCRSLAAENNQFWVVQAEYFERLGLQFLDKSKVGYDTDGDGNVTPEEEISSGNTIYITP